MVIGQEKTHWDSDSVGRNGEKCHHETGSITESSHLAAVTNKQSFRVITGLRNKALLGEGASPGPDPPRGGNCSFSGMCISSSYLHAQQVLVAAESSFLRLRCRVMAPTMTGLGLQRDWCCCGPEKSLLRTFFIYHEVKKGNNQSIFFYDNGPLLLALPKTMGCKQKESALTEFRE